MKSDGQELHRQRQLLEARESAPQRHLPHIVLIEIDEADALVLEMIVKPGAGEQILGVAPMAGTFADDDRGGACAAKGDGGANHDQRIGVDRRARLVLDHVRLEKHTPAANVHAEIAESAPNQRREIDVV